jgi:GNAT superfamily N-acetyltransferase
MSEEIPTEVLQLARKDRWLKGYVKADAHREPVLLDGVVVGFYTPHIDRNGCLQLGPVFVLPEHRGKGLVTAIYRAAPEPLVACVEIGNVESERMVERAGLRRWRRYQRVWHWRKG